MKLVLSDPSRLIPHYHRLACWEDISLFSLIVIIILNAMRIKKRMQMNYGPLYFFEKMQYTNRDVVCWTVSRHAESALSIDSVESWHDNWGDPSVTMSCSDDARTISCTMAVIDCQNRVKKDIWIMCPSWNIKASIKN